MTAVSEQGMERASPGYMSSVIFPIDRQLTRG
jgi:hypothetical protein